jgi:type I restriction-modification system DNA methylase subunit
MDAIPFLNGGLFENLDIVKPEEEIEIRIDCFTDPKKNEAKLRVPDYLFFGTRNVDINEYFESGNYGNVEITGLIDILNRYDFTIDENTPYDQEVALDPELLGLVFENLLASYNPETQSTARKESGSFYTPRPIVDYMVEESLVHYISNDTGLEIDQLRQVFSSTDDQPFDQEEDRSQIIKSISNLKIIDPACGSGAFPMGALQKMVHALAKLDPGNTLWRKSQKERLMQETFAAFESTDLENLKKEVDAIFDNQLNDPDYARKLYLIENCLYGVDIQPIAMQISKLRFFISLLVEQHIDREDENFGIIALPNLETKFVAANTLVKLPKPSGELKNLKIDALEKELETVRHKYFTARTSKTKSKYRQRDKAIREEISELLINDGWSHEGATKITQWDPFNPNSKSKWFDCEWMFGIKHFDIVIGNPPYIQLQKALPNGDSKKYADLYKDLQYQTFERTGDIYALFYEKGMDMLHSKGLLCYITSNKWMRAKYGKSLRKYFSEKKPLQLIDLGPGVFDAATVDVNILLIQNKKIQQQQLLSLTLKDKGQINQLTASDFTLMDDLNDESWIILSPLELALKKKIERIGKPLKDWNISINYGIKTGYNAAFIIDGALKDKLIQEDPKSAEIIKPLLRGRDIKRYKADFADKWLIATHNGYTRGDGSMVPRIEIDDYPAIKFWLDSHWAKLKRRSDQGETPYNLRNCAYCEDFEKNKIIYQEMVQESCFLLDSDTNYFCNDTGRIISGTNLKFLLALFNSNFFFFCIKRFYGGGGLGEAGVRMKHTFFERCPVPKPGKSVQTNFEDIVDIILDKKDQSQDTTTEEQQIDLMVYKLYELDYNEVLIVDPETPITKAEYQTFSLG